LLDEAGVWAVVSPKEERGGRGGLGRGTRRGVESRLDAGKRRNTQCMKTKWWGRPSPHSGEMASPSSKYFFASHLSKNGWPLVEVRWRNDLSGDGGGNGGEWWWLSGSSMFPVGPGCMYFYRIHKHIYAMQKYFMIL